MASSGCYFPFKVDNPHFGGSADAPAKIPVGCGKCPYCLQRRANNWVFRCLIEFEHSSFASFVTLTYENPPISANGFMTVRKRDFQLFIKRLRKHPLNPLTPKINENGETVYTSDIKYYACAEYGTKTKRPHYHCILFNASPTSIYDCWENYHDGHVCNGLVHIGTVTSDSINYCAKYMNKKEFINIHSNDDRQKEFQLFSKQLGVQYAENLSVQAYHEADPTRVFATLGKYKIALPRYYRDKLYGDDAKRIQAEYATEKANSRYDKQFMEYKLSKTPNQSFEQFRYTRKANALRAFQQQISEKRNKI